MHDVKKFFWDEPYFYRSCADGLIRRCVPKVEMLIVLEACHSSPMGGNHTGIWTAHKILQCGYYWQSSIKMLMSSLRHMIGAKEMDIFEEAKAPFKYHSSDRVI